jgi:hypothetical protein
MATTNQWAIPTMDQSQYGMLGKTFKSWGMNADWNGNGEDSLSASIAGRVMNDPALMKQLGLTSSDIQFKAGGYQGDNVIPDQFTLSDKAKQALAGLTMSRTGVAGMKDGRSMVLRDAGGNVMSAGKAYSYDPAGDLKDAVVKGVGFMAAAYGAAQLFGLDGAAAGATSGATGSAAGTAGTTAGTAGTAGAAGSAGGGMLQGIPAMAGDFGAVSASSSAFDTVLSLTGSEALAGAAGKAGFAMDAITGAAGASGGGGSWLSNAWSAITGGASSGGGSLLGGLFGGSSVLRDLLPIIGAGVNQATAEKMAKDQRNWQSAEKQKDRDFEEKKASDTRRRQMPTTGPGLLGKFRVIPGAGNGG